MKVVIFGGGGFIGSAIADLLLIKGYSVTIFERPRVPPYRTFKNHEKITWVTGDYHDEYTIRETIKGCSAIIHLVSSTLPKNSNDNPLYDVQTNVLPTLQLLNEMVRADIKRIVFISSGGTVYGSTQSDKISEKHELQPLVSYGITKLTIERYLNLYSRLHGLKPIILRLSNPYGERQRVNQAQGAIAVFLNKVINNETIEIWGDGSVVRDYIHVSDVASAFLAGLTYEGIHQVFNVGSGIGTSLNQLLDCINRVTGLQTAIKYYSSRSFDVNRNVLDISLANQQLNWKPFVELEDGIFKTFRWYLENKGKSSLL